MRPGISGRSWFPRTGRLLRLGIRGSRTTFAIRTAAVSGRHRSSCGTCRGRVGRRRRSGRTRSNAALGINGRTTSASIPTSPTPAGPAGKPTPAPRPRRRARLPDRAHGHRRWPRDGPPATPRAATGHAPSLPPIRSRGQASARDRKPAMNCGNIGVMSVNGASGAPS